jgi:RHS repeat-associated protein
LGSTSLATTAAGAVHSRQGYYPYGETRYAAGTLPTDFHFTGQRNDATIGLYDYHARWYDPYLNRFISADTIVPSPANPQDLNRYAYVRNNPLVYIDPTGHYVEADQGGNYECYGLEDCMIKSVRDPIYPEGHPRAGYLIPRPEHGARHEHEPLITFEEDRLWPPIQSPKGEEVLSSVAIAVDSFAEGVCAAKAIAAWVGFIGGGSSGYKAVSSKIESSSPGLWENVLGVVGVIAVASADLVGDRLGFDRDTHEIVIGQDTVITVGLAALGFIPDPTWDLAVSTAQFLYDWYRLYNPPRTELHIGSGLHFRFHPLEIDGDR